MTLTIASFLKEPIKAFIPVILRLLQDGSNHVNKNQFQRSCSHGLSQSVPYLGKMPLGLTSFLWHCYNNLPRM